MGIEEDMRTGAIAPATGLTGPRHSVRSQFFAPPSQFDGCFTTFYHLELDVADGGIVEDYLQPEWGNIRFFSGALPKSQIGETSLEGARYNATGPSSLPCHFTVGTTRMWGIGFLPMGWARFVDADAYDLANTVFGGARHRAFRKFDALSGVLCDPDATLEEQYGHIVEVMDGLMRQSRDEPKIVRVHAALVSGEHFAVGELADACGMSIRTLERVCHRYFGFAPKLLMRRQRFMRSLTSFMVDRAQGGGLRWTEAMDGDYHDQAQFTREFTEFMTMTPTQYAALDKPVLTSFMEARARVWGSAAQTLDKPKQGEES
ncbi:AraC family transcriptional regulator [Erythrobacter sp. KY5]|uniref:helix-turn-helix domain-containing protein n=1 Tax=Erythrobacter sp. KY5 TaxID=2011159 RepID=UPI000DBF2ED5|nr:helix-turn-helix domain-containing protein [Erythrobacter sp. KY5]AWW73063.1 AraC family transcriptional regulator [Erythrobacter sp. KY5]